MTGKRAVVAALCSIKSGVLKTGSTARAFFKRVSLPQPNTFSCSKAEGMLATLPKILRTGEWQLLAKKLSMYSMANLPSRSQIRRLSKESMERSIGNAPIRRLLSSGHTCPSTTLDNYCPWRAAGHTRPGLSPQTPPDFLARRVGRAGAAPSTPQEQGVVPSRWRATRLPLAPVGPQQPVGALPGPSVDRAHMLWLPDG